MLTKLKPKSEFSRNVLTLMTGTTIAQAVPIAISPILTRIYTPEDFGVFALYMAIAAIISIIATGRYEMAIMLPKEDEDVNSIVKLILILLSSISVFVFLIVFLFNQEITNLFENKEISNWLYFLPLSIVLTGIYQVFNYLLIREKSFKRLAKNKVIVSTSNASTQLAIGLGSASSFGLLFGNLTGYIVSIFFIIKLSFQSLLVFLIIPICSLFFSQEIEKLLIFIFSFILLLVILSSVLIFCSIILKLFSFIK